LQWDCWITNSWQISLLIFCSNKSFFWQGSRLFGTVCQHLHQLYSIMFPLRSAAWVCAILLKHYHNQYTNSTFVSVLMSGNIYCLGCFVPFWAHNLKYCQRGDFNIFWYWLVNDFSVFDGLAIAISLLLLLNDKHNVVWYRRMPKHQIGQLSLRDQKSCVSIWFLY
jgi:hypothetical protein